MTDSESGFGKGLCYCLGLFLGHQEGLNRWIENWKEMRSKHKDEPNLFKESGAVEMWFNCAADHFYDMQEDSAPGHLKRRECLS